MTNRRYPPKTWTHWSKKKKAKHMDALKQLYGDSHAKEGDVQAKDTNTDGENRTRNVHEMALESLS